MSTPRAEFSATLLRDGRVLVAGGLATNTAESGPDAVGLASAELYDPSTGKWTPTGSMHSPRAQHTATLLRDGRVLVAGGVCPGPPQRCPPKFSPDLDPSGAVSTAELYDPRIGKWTVTGSMTTPRARHTAILLADGRVLVAGAEHADDNFGWPEPFARGIRAETELYDPTTGRWTPTGSMTTARTQQVAALLGDGKVLVAGGVGPLTATTHGLLASAELYDPATGTWALTGSLITKRSQGATAVLLHDGRVLVTGGGGDGDTSPRLASSELYDPGTGAWTATGNLIAARDQFASTPLVNGKVLVVGGFDLDGFLPSAERYDPASGIWSPAGTLRTARWGHSATLLADGRVLVVGGFAGDAVVPTAELYDEGSGN